MWRFQGRKDGTRRGEGVAANIQDSHSESEDFQLLLVGWKTARNRRPDETKTPRTKDNVRFVDWTLSERWLLLCPMTRETNTALIFTFVSLSLSFSPFPEPQGLDEF